MTKWIPKPRIENGQRGASGLLAGEEMTIKPANWETLHKRDDDHENHEEIDVAKLKERRDVEIALEGATAPMWDESELKSRSPTPDLSNPGC